MAYCPEDNLSSPHLVLCKVQSFSLDGSVDKFRQVVKFEDGSTVATGHSNVSKYDSELNKVSYFDSNLLDDSDRDSTSSRHSYVGCGTHTRSTPIPIKGWTTDLTYQVPPHVRKCLSDKFLHCWAVSSHDAPHSRLGRVGVASRFDR